MDNSQVDAVRMPLAAKLALVLVTLQVLSNVVLGGMLLYFAAEEAEHGREAPTLQYVLAVVSLVVGLIAIGCAVALVRRAEWARPVLTVLEGLTIVSGLATLVQGAPQGVMGIVLSVLVIVQLFRAEVTEWLAAANNPFRQGSVPPA